MFQGCTDGAKITANNEMYNALKKAVGLKFSKIILKKMKQKKISKYLFVIYVCCCLLPFDSYSQVTLDFNNIKIMKWSSVRREKKEDIRYRRMTKTIKYIFINTSDYSDSFKFFIGGK